MSRAVIHPLWGSLSLDRAGERSLQEQVVGYFRAAIVDGRVGRGQRLPSSRQLAQDHGISRTTAVEAYERLVSEGYLTARAGSGLFVSERIPEDFLPGRLDRRPRIGPERDRALFGGLTDLRGYQLPLAPGMPAIDLFPWAEWTRILSAVLRERPLNEIGHGDPIGERPLRESVADYLGAMKGVKCDPDHIVIVGGTVQIFEFALRLLAKPGSRVLTEDPTYPFMRQLAERAGMSIVPVPIDRAGMQVEEGLARAPDARIALVSPSHNVPTGADLSIERRRALVEWSDWSGGWIIENEFDGDYRYSSRAAPTCYGMARQGRVVLLGSISKPFAPGLRLGYLLMPPELVDEALGLGIPQASVTLQHAMARFSKSGHLAALLRQLRQVHAERRQILLDALRSEMGELIEIDRAPEAGMRLLCYLPEGTDDQAVSVDADARGVRVEPLSTCYSHARRRPGLLIGFGSTPGPDMGKAVQTLAQVLRDHIASRLA